MLNKEQMTKKYLSYEELRKAIHQFVDEYFEGAEDAEDGIQVGDTIPIRLEDMKLYIEKTD